MCFTRCLKRNVWGGMYQQYMSAMIYACTTLGLCFSLGYSFTPVTGAYPANTDLIMQDVNVRTTTPGMQQHMQRSGGGMNERKSCC